MIQRIQTLYFFAVAALFAALLFEPAVVFFEDGKPPLPASNMMYYLQPFFSVWEMVIAALAFIAVFLYKKRTVQMKLALLNIVFMIGFYVLVGVVILLINNSGNKLDWTYQLNFGIVFPAVGIILSWLAFRAIRKDENLVRSLDRLR
ncbi:MAG: DUF4293 domain-containing protein [Prevotellaceae bacterium]|jgi:hypothetical protein|nr:DUF4293 domain-containing protein [Prevotellaceae bacterium]